MQVRKWHRLVALAGLLTVAACSAQPPVNALTSSDSTVVRTEGGTLRGSAANGVREFQGIPYAAPPVGELRWQDPRPAAPWAGERDATKPQLACAQSSPQPERWAGEDCLYLNVTAPAGGRGEPVVVWLHGGQFTSGAGSLFDPVRWVERGDVVVVTVNFRLGAFGHFAHPGLPGSGTFGLRDQQAALAWVKRNAAAFGGDPGNVTLAGQSSGAMSSCAQLTSPLAAGLFDKAVLQSGGCDVNWPDDLDFRGQPAGKVFLPLPEVEATGRRTAAELGCTGADDAVLACLRALPAEELEPLTGRFANPAYGTPVLPAEPAKALATGVFHRVPVLAGSTRDEGTMSAASYDSGNPIGEQTYDEVLTTAFGPDRPLVEAVYPRSAYGSAAEAWAAITTDRKWACPQYDTSRKLARHTSVHQYEFADPAPPPMSPEPPAMPMGAYHTSELWSLFDLYGIPAPLNPAQRRLSERMIDYWTAFARTGDPGWPGFRAGNAQQLAPDRIGPVDLAAEHHCDFWSAR